MPASLAKKENDFYATARFNMVESQLRTNRVIDDKFLEIVGRLPREAFVPDDQKSFAYSDTDVAMGYGRKLLAPLTLCRMIMALNIAPADRVLDIGAGTGYAAAILNDMAGEVIALESDPALQRVLTQNKTDFLLENTRIVPGALSDGFAPSSPYKAILIEGGVQWVPEKITNQLADGGRMVCVVYPDGDTYGKIGQIRVFERTQNTITEKKLFDASAPLLNGFITRPRFVF